MTPPHNSNPPMPNSNKTPQQLVKDYLDQRAAEDPQFAEKYSNGKKNLKDCWAYIVGEASASAARSGNCCCMSDDEVFGLAVHYYDEENIRIRPVSGVRTSTSAKKEKPEKSDNTKAGTKKKTKTNDKSKPATKKPSKKSPKRADEPKRRVIQLELFDFND